MDEIAKSDLEAMIAYYKKRKTNADFVNFQEKLKDMRERVEKLKRENPGFGSMADTIIQEIEEYQTTRFVGLLERSYEGKIMKIMAMISRLKHFMNAKPEETKSFFFTHSFLNLNIEMLCVRAP